MNNWSLESLTPRLGAAATKGAPDAANSALTQSAALGHRARTPVGGSGGSAFQSQPHHALNLRIADLPRRPRARLIEQTIEAVVKKALPPLADSVLGDPQLPRHYGVGTTAGALQYDARALGQGMRGSRASHRLYEPLAFSATRLKGVIGLPVRIRLSFLQEGRRRKQLIQ